MLGGRQIENIKIYYYKTLDSTNNKAKELRTKEKSYIIYTDNQTNGRGQYNRKWLSRNGLTFSIVIKKENQEYSKIIPVAIIKYLKENGIEATIKYPNDIYYKNRKLGGILIENIYNENLYDKTIIGIGLNVNENEEIIKNVENSISIKIDKKKERFIKEIYLEIYNFINK